MAASSVSLHEYWVEEGTLSDESDAVALLDGRAPGTGRRCRGPALAAVVMGALVAVALFSLPGRTGGVEADAGSKVTLFAPLAAAALLAEGLTSGASIMKYAPALEKVLNKTLQQVEEAREETRNEKPLNLSLYTHLTRQEEIPKENLHDGNLCEDDEEENAGLCYKKCSALTDGQYPIRTTAWSCCKEAPCSFFNSKFTWVLSLCEGFDVGTGKACPHLPGSCFVDEEFNLGMCYKKCAILTNNTFPHRSAPSTCCKYNSHLACLDPTNTKSSLSFAVSGGEDGRTQAHLPMPELTEQ